MHSTTYNAFGEETLTAIVAIEVALEEEFEKKSKNLQNYKNILQVILQKAFQVTPVYREITEWDEETGYHMGVYLCLNKKSHEFTPQDSDIRKLEEFGTFENFKQTWKDRDTKWDSGLVIFLSESKHKIKKKAEQAACKMAIEVLK